MDMIVEIERGIGRFFLHPLTYGFLLIAFTIGLSRVKRERASFHYRIYDVVDDVKLAITGGLIGGLFLSLVTILLGMTIPLSMIVLIGVVYLALCFTFQVQWISPAYAIGLAIILALVLPEDAFQLAIFDAILHTSFPVVLVLLTLLLFLEAWLLTVKGANQTSPVLMKSERGKKVGAHELRRLWLVPVVLFLPVQEGIPTFPYWPVFHIGEVELSPIIVPFGIGVYQFMKGTLPADALQQTGRQVGIFAGMIMVLTLLSFYFPIFVWITIIVAIIGREALNVYHRLKDKEAAPYFSSRKNGLVIVGIIPDSAAEKMGLAIGEVIVKVNGDKVRTENEFYGALQKNNAFCKLEVLDLQGELRLVNGAIYDDEHYELGVLLITEEVEQMEVESNGVIHS